MNVFQIGQVDPRSHLTFFLFPEFFLPQRLLCFFNYLDFLPSISLFSCVPTWSIFSPLTCVVSRVLVLVFAFFSRPFSDRFFTFIVVLAPC